MGGPLVLERARPGQIVPVDSEHSAAGPVPARRHRRGGTPPGAHRERRPVPRPHPRRAGRGDPRAGDGPPDLGHGPGHHDQLGDPGQQGARGDRGAPALRHPLRPDRGRGAPDERRALDGRVRRRLDPGPGQPADDDDPDRAGPGLARPGARRRPAGRLDPARDLGVPPARRRGVPGGRAGPGGRGRGRHRPGGLQRRQRGVRRRLPRRPAARSPTSWPRLQAFSADTTYPRGSSSPSTTSSPPTPGPATAASRPAGTIGRAPHDRPVLPPRSGALRRSPSWPRSACTSSAT